MKYFCSYCKCESTGEQCESCGHSANQYEHIVPLTPLRRHKTPGEPMIIKDSIENIRDGPTIGVTAVLKFHGRGLPPDKTMIVFYPSGVNALNYPILLQLIELRYHICVMYFDSLSSQYF